MATGGSCLCKSCSWMGWVKPKVHHKGVTNLIIGGWWWFINVISPLFTQRKKMPNIWIQSKPQLRNDRPPPLDKPTPGQSRTVGIQRYALFAVEKRLRNDRQWEIDLWPLWPSRKNCSKNNNDCHPIWVCAVACCGHVFHESVLAIL